MQGSVDLADVTSCGYYTAPGGKQSIVMSTAVRLCLSLHSSISPPTVTYLPYRVSGSTLTAVGRSQLLTRCPGTHSRILSGIQRAAQTVLGVYLKRTCSRVTSASSALGVLNDYARYKSTHALTHSETICPIFTKFLVHFTYGGGAVVLWRRREPLFTCSFIFAHNGCELAYMKRRKNSTARLKLATTDAGAKP